MRTIDDVLNRLDGIIETSIRERSPVGYFAALYRGTTQQIKAMINEGGFEDGERIERLDVVFASRYIAAYDAYRQGGQTTDAWAVAFQAASSVQPSILQHLLLGMNAHINLDLGIATAQVCPGTSILAIRDDFNKVNEVMSANTTLIDHTMARLSPVSRLIEWAGGKEEDEFVYFNVMIARLGAWSLAEDLALCQPSQYESTILKKDQQVAAIGRKIWQPGSFLGLAARVVRMTEERDVQRVIEILLEATPPQGPGARAKAG